MMRGPREDSTSVERCFGHLRQMGNSMVGSCFAFFISTNSAASSYFRNIPFKPALSPEDVLKEIVKLRSEDNQIPPVSSAVQSIKR